MTRTEALRLHLRSVDHLENASKADLVALASSELVDDDYAAVRAHGFSDEDLWDIGAIAAFLSNQKRYAKKLPSTLHFSQELSQRRPGGLGEARLTFAGRSGAAAKRRVRPAVPR